MKVVHVSLTPLAGSPIRIVNTTNHKTNINARLVNLNPNAYGKRTFEEDLCWDKNLEESKEVLAEADIIHFHHFFDFNSDNNPFEFNFLKNKKKSAKYLMHWHSVPSVISRMTGFSETALINLEIPQVVVAQFHETYYPNASPVPLIVQVESLAPVIKQRDIPQIFFSPSSGNHAYIDRWETKGKPEVLRVLERGGRSGIWNFKIVENMSFQECSSLRARSDIVIDDLVTGGFHTTCLEGLALGKPTLSYLDHRSQLVLSELTQTTDLPIINIRYTHCFEALKELSLNQKLREEIGAFSRNWMVQHHSEAKMIGYYEDIYYKLLEGHSLKNPRFNDFKKAKTWLYLRVPDLIWASRKQCEISVSGSVKNLKKLIAVELIRNVKHALRRNKLIYYFWSKLKKL